MHLNQIYDGFEKLRKLGVVTLSVKRVKQNAGKPVLTVIVENRFKVVYDTLDGNNWIEGTEEENLRYFEREVKADFYFKRSFSKLLFDHAPRNCKIYPLGLNYGFEPEGRFPKNFIENIKDFARGSVVIEKIYKKTIFSSKDFEYYPIPNKKNKVLFLTRLWDPEDSQLEHIRIEREKINSSRISYIKSLRKEFGDQFFGGLQETEFAKKHAKNLVVPYSISQRERFLKTVREHNVCITSLGLHNSIGWKFAEYVAASRAIVTEPLAYEIPGNFKVNENYLIYRDESELLKNVKSLLDGKEETFDMMNKNFKYFNNYVSPDKLVLNSLVEVYRGISR